MPEICVNSDEIKFESKIINVGFRIKFLHCISRNGRFKGKVRLFQKALQGKDEISQSTFNDIDENQYANYCNI